MKILRLVSLAVLPLFGFLLAVEPVDAGGCGVSYSRPTYSAPYYAPSPYYAPAYPPPVYLTAYYPQPYYQPSYIPVLFSTYQAAAISTFQSSGFSTVEQVREVKQVPVSLTTTTTTQTSGTAAAAAASTATTSTVEARVLAIESRMSAVENRIVASETKVLAKMDEMLARLTPGVAPPLRGQEGVPPPKEGRALTTGKAVAMQRCAVCHDEKNAKDKGDGHQLFRDGDVWMTDKEVAMAYRRVLSQEMPPPKEPRLEQAEGNQLVQWMGAIKTVDKKKEATKP